MAFAGRGGEAAWRAGPLDSEGVMYANTRSYKYAPTCFSTQRAPGGDAHYILCIVQARPGWTETSYV